MCENVDSQFGGRGLVRFLALMLSEPRPLCNSRTLRIDVKNSISVRRHQFLPQPSFIIIIIIIYNSFA